MKIVYLITKSNWGGAQKYVYNLIEAGRQNYQVVAVFGGTGTPGTSAGLLSQKIKDFNDVKTVHVPSFARDIFIWLELKAFWEILLILHKEKPDILHVNSSKAAGMGALAGRILGIKKIIFTVHGWPFKEQRFFLSRALIWLATWVTGLLAHQIIVISKNDYQIGIKIPGFKNKIKLIYNGIAEPIRLAQEEAKEKLGLKNLPAETWVLGTIAELHPNKSLKTVVEALVNLPQNVHYVIMGDGEEKANLENLAQKLNLSERVHLLGFIPEAARYLAALNAFVLPSAKEGQPYVLLEAGLSSLPCLGSNISGINDILDEDSGYLFPYNDAATLANQIKKVIADPAAASHRANNLKQKILAEFSQAKMLDQTFSLYQK